MKEIKISPIFLQKVLISLTDGELCGAAPEMTRQELKALAQDKMRLIRLNGRYYIE